MQPEFATSHFLKGFAHADGKFRFRPDWTGTLAPNRPPKSMGLHGPVAGCPKFPDHVDLIEDGRRRASVQPRHLAGALLPEFELHRNADVERKGGPAELFIHPDDAAGLGIAAGDRVEIGNARGEVVLHAKLFDGSSAACHRRRRLAERRP